MKIMLRKTILFLTLTIFVAASLKAQNLEEAKKLVYYEKYESAKKALKAIVDADPNNEEAIYWLGQSMIRPEESTPADWNEAKKLYQSKMSNKDNNLITAGIGHIELLEGKVQDARNHFEAAVSLSQSKSIAVLNAVGYANGNPDAKNGDPAYAIDKLKQATQLKKFNNPDVWVNLGDAYRKIGDGGQAILSYNAALAIDSKYARADYRIGKVYQTQGRGQESLFMEYFNKAMTNDPAYAPVYSNLFYYYYETDVPKASMYYEKWMANADKGSKSCYYKALLKYAEGLFMEAISHADACIASEGNYPYPGLFGLKANAYNRLKDSIHTVENYNEYFKRQDPEKITSADYIECAKNMLKINLNETQAGLLIDKAVAMDSVEANKILYLKSIAQLLENRKAFKNAAEYYSKIITVKKNPSKTDLNNIGFSYFKAGEYQKSLDAFSNSATAFSDDPYALNMISKIGTTLWAIDSTLSLGLANPAFEKTIQFGLADTVKYKSQLLKAYKYFVAYNANIAKDKNKALEFVEKALALDPADQEANEYKNALMKKPSTKPSTEAKKP
jgi:tetratricopeptide (TPR) repeat protein